MCYWRDNPEEMEEIATDYLPEPWQTQVLDGEVEFDDVPQEIRTAAIHEAVTDGYLEDVAKDAFGPEGRSTSNVRY